MTMQRAEIVLPVRGFDLQATVLANRTAELPPWRWRAGARPVLERAEQLADGTVHLLRIRPGPGGVVLEVTGRAAREVEVLAPLARRIRRALALDLDLHGFHERCRDDPLLRPARRLARGRLVRGTTPFEDAVTVLVASNVTWRSTVASLARLVSLGRRCPADPARRAFPTPAALASLPLPELRRRTELGRRAAWIQALARDIVAGRLDLDALRALPGPHAARLVGAMRGFGPVATAQLLLRLGHYGSPVLDGATRSFVRWAFGDDRAPFERWLQCRAPWGGLALWWASRATSPIAPAAGTRRRPSGRR